MNTTTVVLVLGLGALGVGGFLLYSHSQKQAAQTNNGLGGLIGSLGSDLFGGGGGGGLLSSLI